MISPGSDKKKKFPYHWKITLVILAFTLTPCLAFGGIYLKNARGSWIHNALASYYNDTDNTALLLSGHLNSLDSKMNYLTYNSTIRTLISRVDDMSLPLALDMIYELENAVSAIMADSPNLTVRWYPMESSKSYGMYCYPFSMFEAEFRMEEEEDRILYETILSMEQETGLWAVRSISRRLNNTGPVQTVLWN